MQERRLPADWSNIAVHTSKIPELSPPSCQQRAKQQWVGKTV
jgi:hypothetical protein